MAEGKTWGEGLGGLEIPLALWVGLPLVMSRVAIRFKKKRKSLGAEAGEEKGNGVRKETQGPASVES